MQMYAGIDLHSSNNYIGIIDEQDKRIFGKRLDNHLPTMLSVLEPFKSNLENHHAVFDFKFGDSDNAYFFIRIRGDLNGGGQGFDVV